MGNGIKQRGLQILGCLQEFCLPGLFSQAGTFHSQGSLNLDFTPMNLFGVDREGWKLPDTRHWPSMQGKLVGAVKLEMEHFFDCVLNDRLPLISGEDGRRSLEVMLAAEQSIAEGGVVKLPLK